MIKGEIPSESSDLIKDFTYCPTISKREFLYPFLLGVCVCVLGSFPYIYGKSLEDESRVFMGMVGRGTHGSFGYIMFQRQAWEGNNWLTNQCTPEHSDTRFFNVEWWLLGKISRLLHISVLDFFHIDRCFSVFFFLFVVYYLLAIILDSVYLRQFVLLLITVGSGFGWCIWLFNRWFHPTLPLSWDIEGIQIFSYLICKPHFIRSITFAVLMYVFLIHGFQTERAKYFILCGLMALIHSLMRPYLIPESYIMFAITPILFCLLQKKWEKKWFFFCAIPAIIHFPAVLYYLWISISDSLGMAGWSQNHQFMGKPGFLVEYVFGVGWTWLVCMVFFVYLVRKCQERISFLILFLWIFVAWGLCNLYPYWKPGQESGLYAFIIVPPILTMVGPYHWLNTVLGKQNAKDNVLVRVLLFLFSRRILLAVLIILFSIPTTIFVYYSMFRDLKYGHIQWAYFLSREAYSALEYLKNNGEKDDVILASPKTSQFIFAFTPCKTVTGHFMLTKDYVKKTEDVYRFYGKRSDTMTQKEILKKYRVNYVFVGPFETEISAGQFEIFGDYNVVFDKGNTRLYYIHELSSPYE